VQGSGVTSPIVTPEGVVLDFDMAGVASRLLARLVDSLIQLTILYVSTIVTVVLSVSSPTLAIVGFIVLVFALLFLYPMILEAKWGGRTVGKMALGLRVVTVEGGPARMRHTAIRSMLQLIDVFATAGGAAVMAALTSVHGQRLGDMAAGTYVIRDRRSRGQVAESEVIIHTPSNMQSLVDSLDPTSLDISQGSLIRSVLIRTPELTDDARNALTSDLANRVSATIGTAVPPSVHPETFLACVAARGQQLAIAATVSSLPPPPSERPPPPPPRKGAYSRFVGRSDI